MKVKSNGIDVVIRMENGYPDEAIVQVAGQVNASMIVVGTRGLTGFKRFLLGSVAEKIVRTSPTNVVVARGEPSEFSRLLVATDFSPASERALQVAMALASPNAHIDVLHAWQYPPGIRGAVEPTPSEGPLVSVARDIIHRAERLGEALTKRYASDTRTVTFTNVFGPPGAIIHERLESNSYDMVAMGTHGHRGFRRFLLGSVAEATVRHAPCSVLVTHTANAD